VCVCVCVPVGTIRVGEKGAHCNNATPAFVSMNHRCGQSDTLRVIKLYLCRVFLLQQFSMSDIW
jgi:hypothetical protein